MRTLDEIAKELDDAGVRLELGGKVSANMFQKLAHEGLELLQKQRVELARVTAERDEREQILDERSRTVMTLPLLRETRDAHRLRRRRRADDGVRMVRPDVVPGSRVRAAPGGRVKRRPTPDPTKSLVALQDEIALWHAALSIGPGYELLKEYQPALYRRIRRAARECLDAAQKRVQETTPSARPAARRRKGA